MKIRKSFETIRDPLSSSSISSMNAHDAPPVLTSPSRGDNKGYFAKGLIDIINGLALHTTGCGGECPETALGD
jgi:hypothetical protein